MPEESGLFLSRISELLNNIVSLDKLPMKRSRCGRAGFCFIKAVLIRRNQVMLGYPIFIQILEQLLELGRNQNRFP